MIAAGAGYLAAAEVGRRRDRRSRRWPRRRSACFLAGLAVLLVALDSGVGAGADSHLALPRVTASAADLSATDFVTFRSLDSCPLAMTAHVVYEAIDPQRPATTSPKVIRDVIRGEIGFEGLLMSDDLSMKALDGPLSVRANKAQFAGCDLVLHCNGDMDEMRDVASEVTELKGRSLKRSEQALAHLSAPAPFDPAAAELRLAALLGGTA